MFVPKALWTLLAAWYPCARTLPVCRHAVVVGEGSNATCAVEAFPVAVRTTHFGDAARGPVTLVASRKALVGEVMAAVREYVKKTGRRVVFEYALIDQLNSRPEHAVELAALLRDLQGHVNLIPLNHVDERALRPASAEAVQRFLHTLESRHISATVRREMGSDIGGACGQLRRRELEGKSKE